MGDLDFRYTVDEASDETIGVRKRTSEVATRSALWLHHTDPFVAAAEKRPVSCREAEGLVTKLWSARTVTIHWMRSLWLLQTKLLAAAGWKWGCQPFSCPCSQNDCNMWLQKRLEKRSVRHVCFGNLFALFFFAKTFNSWRDQRVGEDEFLELGVTIQLEPL